MADVLRWKYGDTNPVVANVRASESIEKGDLLYMERTDGFARPFSALVDLGSLGANQAYLACRFLGVAEQRHRAAASADPDDPTTITVSTTGTFEFPCGALAAAVHLGNYVGADENAAGTAVLDQQVEQVNIEHPDRAIGRVASEGITGDTLLKVRIHSAIMEGDFSDDCNATSSSSSGA